MNSHIVLKTISKFLIPLILMFGLYVQFHGEYSPGGGFQAGVICASSFIIYGFVNGLEEMQKLISIKFTRIFCSFGALLYAAVGVIAMLKGSNFLSYSALAENAVDGQKIGILIIELGVGITVFSVMILLFYGFAMRTR